MNATKTKAVLFDFDGVVVDTEAQYSKFWHRIGEEYLGMDDMEGKVKGQTLVYIYDAFFNGRMKEQAEITESLNRFEQEMSYDFIPGVLDVLEDLRRHNAGIASGSTVIGLTTTNSREAIAPLCHHILDDFIGFTYDKLTRLHK